MNFDKPKRTSDINNFTPQDLKGCWYITYIIIVLLSIALASSGHTAACIILLLVFSIIILFIFSRKVQSTPEVKLSQYPNSSIPLPIKQKNKILETQFLSQTLYSDLIRQSSCFVEFAKKLDSDSKFHEYTNDLSSVNISLADGKFGELDPHTFVGKILLLTLIDLSRSLMYAGHKLDLNTKEGFGILIMMCDLYGNKISYDTIDLYRRYLVTPSENLLNELLVASEPEEKFIISKIINDFNADYKLQYHILIYRFISLISKCDTVVTQQESNWMDEIMALGKTEVIKPAAESLSEDKNHNPIDELNTLIGLDNVKNEIKKLTNLIKIQNEREKKGLKVTNPTYHFIFTGKSRNWENYGSKNCV